MPLVTIYVVCNNHQEFVRQAVESALAQTYADVEIIAFDNGSQDASPTILRDLQAKHDFTLIEQENVGLVATIESAFAMATGEYVVRLDADDWLAPEAIERLVKPLQEAPDVGMAFPDYYEVATDGRVLRRIRRRTFDDNVTLLDQPAHGAVTLTRKSAYFDVGGIDRSINAQDGLDLWLKIIRKYRVQNVPEALFYYRRHDGNLTNDVVRILKQRYAIFRNHSDEVRASDYLGVIVLPKMPSTSELFLTRKFGSTTLFERSLGKLASSEICRSVLVVCPVDTAEAVASATAGFDLDVRVHAAPPHANGYHEVASLMPEFPQVKNLIFISPQNPFMYLNYVDAMIHYKSIFKVASVHSCIVDNHLVFQHNGKSLALFNDGSERHERDAILRKAGGLMLIDAQAFAEHGHGLIEPIGHIEIDEISGFEVGSPISFRAAEVLGSIW